jgi:hypothetical protein
MRLPVFSQVVCKVHRKEKYKDCTIIKVAVNTKQRTQWLPQHFSET